MQSVVVTGASTGIGYGIAKVLTEKGWRVFGSVRKPEDGVRVRDALGENFHPLIFDITDESAVASAAGHVGEMLGSERLAGLVNNAGVAFPGPLAELPVDEFRQQLEINVTGQLIVTQAFAPLLGTDPERKGTPGRIVNITSVGGKLGSPFLGAYVASKHAMEGFSESLRREFMLYGIDVIIVGPGSVATPIWDKADELDIERYSNSPFLPALKEFQKTMIENGRKGLPPERIGEAVATALTAARPKARYAVVPNALQNWVLPRLLPRRLVDRVFASRLGLKR